MVVYDMQEDDNSVFNNNQDRWAISKPSKYLSCVKRSHLVASPVKLIFCGLSPFCKVGAKYTVVRNVCLFKLFW
jgi:hypothetical protein